MLDVHRFAGSVQGVGPLSCIPAIPVCLHQARDRGRKSEKEAERESDGCREGGGGGKLRVRVASTMASDTTFHALSLLIEEGNT